MTTISFIQRADDDTLFAPAAFDGQIGKEVPINLPNGLMTRGVVIGAEVAADGRSVELMIEISADK